MNRYNKKTAKWQQQNKEEQKMNKTEFIKVRCTLEEKQRIKSKAESTGRKFSDYCREILLNGEVIAVPKMTDNEREAIELLRRTAYFFSHISNLIKVKDDAWVLITQSLSYLAREAFKRFFNPKYHIEERAIKLLNLMERDLCKTLILKFAHYIIFLYLYGMKQTLSSPSFADVVLGQRKVKQTFFSQIDKLIDWTPIRGIIEIAYTKGYKSTGRPSYDSLILFKIELLRTWYGLSDGEVEEQVNDRLSFSRFVGLGLEDTAPDSTTVCRFRNTLVEAELYDMVLNEINRQLESKGVIVKRGAIIDASITDTPRRPRGRKEYEVVEDRNEADSRDSSEKAMVKEVIKPNVDGDARWIKKMGKLHFGYKRHTVTDENGLILAEETTAANESDIKHLETPLQKANLPVRTPVYADKGYNSSENKEVLTRMKLKSRIMHKGVRGKKITEREQRINVSISKIRYRVERTFGSMHRWFRAGVARYVGLAKTHAQHIMEAVAYNLYRTPGIIVSNSLK